MAVTSSSSSSIPSAEKVPPTKSTLWQEEMRAQDQPDGSSLSPAQSPSQSQPPVASSLREPGLESREGEQHMLDGSRQGALSGPHSPGLWSWTVKQEGGAFMTHPRHRGHCGSRPLLLTSGLHV